MDMLRRKHLAFDLSCSVAVGALTMGPAGAAEPETLDSRQEWLVGGGQFAQSNEPGKQRKTIAVMSLQNRQPRLIDVDFFPHGFAIDPLRPQRVASFQKIGPGAAMVDLASGKVLATIAPKGSQQFYGHGAFTADGKVLLSTERDEQARRGLIGMRDARTLEYLGEFPSFGDSPHDCHLIENGKTLVVANGDGSVAFIDIHSQKLIEKLSIPNRRFNAGHLHLLPQRKFIAVSAPAKGLAETELGGISVRLSKKAWSSLSEPADLVAKMVGEALSIAVSPLAGAFAVTHPSANLVSFWSTETAAPLGTLSLVRPRGAEISRDGRHFLISHGQHAGLAVVDAKSLAVLEQPPDTAYFSSSHILNWSRATPSAA